MLIEDILSLHKVRGTSCRRFIIRELLAKNTAITEQEIKAECAELFDRVTIYRTLKTLETSGAIHKIVLNNNIVKYAVTLQAHHHQVHSHFHCTKCNAVHCLSSEMDFNVNLPKGFVQDNVEVIINGLCNQCNA